MRAGPLWIGPPWLDPPRGARAVVIDPGRAFGTGAHATTRLCIELLAELEAASLLDLGCGSGVVAIAGVLLGFSPVVAVDNDPAAVEASVRNAHANSVSIEVRQLDLTEATLPRAEIAVANISLEQVEKVLERVDARHVVVSGYLERDEPQSVRYRRRARRVREGWAADVFDRAQ